MLQWVLDFIHVDLILQHNSVKHRFILNLIEYQMFITWLTKRKMDIQFSTEKSTLKNSTNFVMSLADSRESIFLPCFSEILCRISFAPVSILESKCYQEVTIENNLISFMLSVQSFK